MRVKVACDHSTPGQESCETEDVGFDSRGYYSAPTNLSDNRKLKAEEDLILVLQFSAHQDGNPASIGELVIQIDDSVVSHTRIPQLNTVTVTVPVPKNGVFQIQQGGTGAVELINILAVHLVKGNQADLTADQLYELAT